MLLVKLNADIKKYVQQLGAEGLSAEEKAEIEKNIELTKAKIRDKLNE